MSNKKDWTGNKNSIYKTLGASNHTEEEREVNDFYATSPEAATWLLKLETLDKNIWECSAGEGHLSKVFEEAGHKVYSTDLVDRGYGIPGINFLEQTKIFNGDIISNPPYKYATEFVEKGLELIKEGNKVIMFLKIQFLESKGRRKLFDKNPPKVVYVSSSRMACAKNGDFEKYKESAACYCWMIWEKGYKGDTVIKWFN